MAEADTNVPVVESYLAANGGMQVQVFKQLVFTEEDTNVHYLNALEILLHDGNQWKTLEFQDSGKYTNNDVVLHEGNTYKLKFEYNDKLVEAETIIPSKPDSFAISSSSIEAFSFGAHKPGEGFERPDPVELTWNNPNNEYHMIVVENIEDDPELISSDDNHPPRAFRNAPVQGDNAQLEPMVFTYYGTHRVILYKLNSEYAALYEQLGNSSLDIVAPPTNIENGLGIFTGINSDTLLIEVVESSK
jgi:hypothetical protein